MTCASELNTGNEQPDRQNHLSAVPSVGEAALSSTTSDSGTNPNPESSTLRPYRPNGFDIETMTAQGFLRGQSYRTAELLAQRRDQLAAQIAELISKVADIDSVIPHYEHPDLQ
jgi:hypothetical protein